MWQNNFTYLSVNFAHVAHKVASLVNKRTTGEKRVSRGFDIHATIT